MAFYQERILDNWQQHDRQAVRGPRGLGKSTLAAWCVLSFALTHDGSEDWKVITTASKWRQLKEYLWPEIHKWSRFLNWELIGRDPFDTRFELQSLRLKLSTGQAIAISSGDPETLEGAHEDNLFFVFDEAKIIPDETWDALEGTFSGAGMGMQYAKVLAISTPGEPVGRFYSIHRRESGYEDWHVEHVRKMDAVKAQRLNLPWAEQRKKQWGEFSQMYQNQIEGNFWERDEDTIIPISWVEEANYRWEDWQDAIKEGMLRGQVTSAGCDIGLAGGGDPPFCAMCYDDSNVEFYDLSSVEKGDENKITMATAGHMKGLIDKFKMKVFIDVIGIGRGVYERLYEQGYTETAIPFNAAEKTLPSLKDETKQFTFRNKRAAMWWLGRELLDPKHEFDIALPKNDQLMQELSIPKYEILSNAVIKVESKKDIRKRLGRSTNMADAVLQALTGPIIYAKKPTQIYVVGQGYVRK